MISSLFLALGLLLLSPAQIPMPVLTNVVCPAGTYVVTIPGSPTITQTPNSVTFSWATDAALDGRSR